MNEYLESIILGIIQGLTEFLPVSSSGHLELAKWLLGDQSTAGQSFLMTVVLHFGTALATVWVFRKFLLDVLLKINKPEGRKFIWFIIISMIPAALVGVLFEHQIETMFEHQVILVAVCLCITGLLLLLSDSIIPKGNPNTTWRSLIIGIVQAIAILPGISRSGSTIVTGVGLGIDRREAAQFSFIMVIPLIFAKIAKDVLEGNESFNQANAGPLFVGLIFSFIFGVISCRWMVTVVKKAKLRYFGYYCLVIGIAAICLKLWIIKN
jgi:undecaprenyl-diphosphatase